MSTRNSKLKLAVGQRIKFDEVIIQLHTFGYERVSVIQSFGQFSVAGGLIKVYSAASINPVAIDFFGDQIDKIYSFDLPTNKRMKNLDCVEIPDNVIEIDGNKICYGDLVVHINHGIGIYRGKILKKIGSSEKEFFAIEYANGDQLFLPPKMQEKISKYLGISRRTPRLSRLGSTVWEKRKKKIQESIWVLAKDLLEVYAKREIVSRPKYKIDLEWDQN